jgi:hypothetical protein
MNVKPGDLAIMVTCGIDRAVGLIVEVLTAATDKGFGPMWNCSAVSGAKSDTGFCLPGERCLIPDAWLRPIRDPGDDAVDEMLLLVPSPAFERAYAETYGGGA